MPTYRGLQIPGGQLDRVVVDEVLDGKSYPKPPLKPGESIDLIVDIGAHVGAAAVYFHGLWPKAHIVCLEPSQRTFKLLQHNAPFAEYYPFALGSHDHQAALSLGAETVMQTLYADDGTGQLVCVRNAAQMFEAIGQPDVIKLDAEGAEPAIMKSAVGYFQKAKVVYVEFHRWHDRPWIDFLHATHVLFSAKIDYSPNRGELAYIHKDAIDPAVLAYLLLPE